MSKTVVHWDARTAEAKIQQVVIEALWLAGQNAITLAMNDVPLDTGTLRRSGTVTVDTLPEAQQVYREASSGKGNKGKTIGASAPKSSSKAPTVYVSYNTPYAIWLHESQKWTPRAWRKTATGKTVPKPAVGRWKWLENVLPKVRSRWDAYVTRAKRKVGL